MIIGGIDISRKYSYDEIMELNARGLLRPIAVHGYIVRADSDGMIGFVPASESTLFRAERGKLETHVSHDFAEDMRQQVEREHPMIRRTAQERRVALVKRLLNTARQYGTIPGLSDEQISTMIGERWKTGVSVVTEDMLSRVAQRLLERAGIDNVEADRHRVVKAHPLAHDAT